MENIVNMAFKTPILLITFNRPNHVRRVLTEILKQEPQLLYVSQDGAREGNENDRIRCQEVKDVINELTSAYAANHPNFTLYTLHHTQNLGCGPGPAAGLTWFFEHVEMGLIFEDDAVPHSDFFAYAAELLEKYKDDESIRAIGSMNIDRQKWGDGSYYFSMMNRNLCAWATWRRAWKDFNLYLRDVSWRQLDKALKHYGCSFYERDFWLDRLDEAQKDAQGGKSWDMQFFMSIWLQHGKGIIPNVNLSSNIGTVGEGTHQMGKGNIIDNVPTNPILPMAYPTDESIQSGADRDFYYRYFDRSKHTMSWWIAQINKRIKRITGHQGPWLKKYR